MHCRFSMRCYRCRDGQGRIQDLGLGEQEFPYLTWEGPQVSGPSPEFFFHFLNLEMRILEHSPNPVNSSICFCM